MSDEKEGEARRRQVHLKHERRYHHQDRDAEQSKNEWSADLQASTRERLSDLSVLPTPAGEVAFKHIGGAFATMAETCLLDGNFKLADRRSGAVTIFACVDELVGAGWALD